MKTSTFAIALILSQYIDVSTAQLANASIKRTRTAVDEQVSSSNPQQQQVRVNTARLLSKKTRRKKNRNLQEMSVPSNDMMSLNFDGMCMSAATTVVSGSFAKNGDLVAKGEDVEPLEPASGPGGGHQAKSSKVYKTKSEKVKSTPKNPMAKAEKEMGDAKAGKESNGKKSPTSKQGSVVQ